MNRYEFLEIIVRIANQLYKETKKVTRTAEAVNLFLKEKIYPNAEMMDGETFRRLQCYNVKVNELLKKNEPVIKKVYDSYTHAKKKFIRYDECKEYIRGIEFSKYGLSDRVVGTIFAESMQTMIDTIGGKEKLSEMRYTEFLVFLVRIAYESYRNTPYETEHMYLKLEKRLP